MQSPNLVQKNINSIRALFPNCVTETKGDSGETRMVVDFDQLRQELAGSIVEGPQERYHLNWPGKREALLTANASIAKTLRPCREESVDFDTTKNLFIEGDNLDALKLLQENYLGKINLIYIDPPYNTGTDFLYRDNFAESVEDYLVRSNQKNEQGKYLIANTVSNGRFHSDWYPLCTFLSKHKWARRDSNPRPPGYEPGALTGLSYGPKNCDAAGLNREMMHSARISGTSRNPAGT